MSMIAISVWQGTQVVNGARLKISCASFAGSNPALVSLLVLRMLVKPVFFHFPFFFWCTCCQWFIFLSSGGHSLNCDHPEGRKRLEMAFFFLPCSVVVFGKPFPSFGLGRTHIFWQKNFFIHFAKKDREQLLENEICSSNSPKGPSEECKVFQRRNLCD